MESTESGAAALGQEESSAGRGGAGEETGQGVAAAEAARREGGAVWTGERLAHLGVSALLVGVVFWWLQFSTGSICCGDYDGYYHVGWSRMLWEGIRNGYFPPVFTQLPLTTLNPRDYVDHHFLFHLLQIPFNWFRDPVLGAKIGTMIFSTLAVVSCYWLLLRYRVRYPFLWLLALLASATPFLFRMSMAKAMSVSVVLLVVGIHFLFERKYRWLGPLAFAFALAYDMWALLCVAAFVWAAVVWWAEGRVEWRPVLWSAAGSLAGFVVNPYFPRNVRLFAEHLLMKVRGGDFPVAVGGEWYPYNSWEFLMNCLVAFAAALIGYVAFEGKDRRASARALFFLVFSTVLLVANARWQRFAEYWPPFAVLFAAFALQQRFDAARKPYGAQLPPDVLEDLGPLLDRDERPAEAERRRRARRWEYAVVAAIAVLLGAKVVGNAVITSRDIAESAPPDFFVRGAEWLRANVPPGEMIFNTDWDDFPRLFYFAPQYRYVSGLDPNYLHDQNRELSDLYGRIGKGEEGNPGPLIRERFGARYVFTDNYHEDFYNKALDSGWFDEVYSDEDCTILRVREQKGDPPPVNEDQNANEGGDQEQQQPQP